MQELKLKVNTGAVKVAVEDENGRKIGEFEIIPTDGDIINRYGKVVDFLNNIKFDQEASEDEKEEKIRQFSAQIREQLDYLLNYPVSENIFRRCGPLTVTQNGDFFFVSVLDGICNIIEQLTNKRTKKKLNKIKSATAKYHK